MGFSAGTTMSFHFFFLICSFGILFLAHLAGASNTLGGRGEVCPSPGPPGTAAVSP